MIRGIIFRYYPYRTLMGLSAGEADPLMDDTPVKENAGGQPEIPSAGEEAKYRAVSAPSRLLPHDLTMEEAVRRLRAMDGFTAVIAASNRSLDKLVRLTARMISDVVGDQVIITLLNTDNETYH